MELAVDHGMPRRSVPPGRRDAALAELLVELGDRVKPVALARERTLPVAEAVAGRLPEGGLVRGHVVSCRGAAGVTLAFAVVCEAMAAGAWLAVVDVADLGADAAAEGGVPLERIVRIDATRPATDGASDELGEGSVSADVSRWIEVVGAAVDGFDLVMVRVPAALRGQRTPAAVRKLLTRVQQHGGVVITLGDAGALGGDVELSTQRSEWRGLGDGAGYLRARRVDAVSAGRRVPNGRTASFEVVGAGPRVELRVAPVRSESGDVERADPQADVLAEMVRAAPSMADSSPIVEDLAG